MLIEVDTFFQKNLYSSERLKKRRIRGEKFLFVFFKHEIKKVIHNRLGINCLQKHLAKNPSRKHSFYSIGKAVFRRTPGQFF